jgi:hypothetical protein
MGSANREAIFSRTTVSRTAARPSLGRLMATLEVVFSRYRPQNLAVATRQQQKVFALFVLQF